MKEIALSLVEYPKGILAADESTSTMNRRLDEIVYWCSESLSVPSNYIQTLDLCFWRCIMQHGK